MRLLLCLSLGYAGKLRSLVTKVIQCCTDYTAGVFVVLVHLPSLECTSKRSSKVAADEEDGRKVVPS